MVACLDAWLTTIEAGDSGNVDYTPMGSTIPGWELSSPSFWVRSADDYDDDNVDDDYVVNNLVTGYAVPYAPVMVTLKRNGGVLAFMTLEADEWGYYMAYLRDRNGLVADIHAGRRGGGPERRRGRR